MKLVHHALRLVSGLVSIVAIVPCRAVHRARGFLATSDAQRRCHADTNAQVYVGKIVHKSTVRHAQTLATPVWIFSK